MGSVEATVRARNARQRAQAAFELHETAQSIMRQNLRRRHPQAAEAEIEALLEAWRRRRPGAESGDGVGRPIAGEELARWLASKTS